MEVDIRSLAKEPLYSEELEINLRVTGDKEIFKWLLASLLFGARLTETIANNTYRAFERHGLLDPQKIVSTGWDFLGSPTRGLAPKRCRTPDRGSLKAG